MIGVCLRDVDVTESGPLTREFLRLKFGENREETLEAGSLPLIGDETGFVAVEGKGRTPRSPDKEWEDREEIEMPEAADRVSIILEDFAERDVGFEDEESFVDAGDGLLEGGAPGSLADDLEVGKVSTEGFDDDGGLLKGDNCDDEGGTAPFPMKLEALIDLDNCFGVEDTRFTGGLAAAELAAFVKVGIFFTELGAPVDFGAAEGAAPSV